MVEHRSLGHLVEWARQEYGLGVGDRGGFLTNVGFDPTLEELAAYLGTGAALHMAPDDLRLDPAGMMRWILDRRLTVCQLPAPVLETIIDEEWPADASLRLFLTGGDRLRKRARAGAPFEVVNRYGPTECTVYCTQQRISRFGGDQPGSIGRPIANTRIYLLDAQGEPVPVGVSGEIYVGGVGVARGYWEDEPKTSASFVPDRFGPTPNRRLYRTGDLARYLPDGTLEFLGRADGQVKIRGMRIELGEIESVLRSAEGISDALVTAHKGALDDTCLVAYVVAADAGPFGESSLRQFARERLPEAMVPSHFILLPGFPLTANGKVDLKRLPAPESRREARPRIAPEGELAQKIARVWGEVLNLPTVGAEENFFDLGGHSLLLAKVQGRLSLALSRDVKLADLLRYPTVKALATALGQTAAQASQKQNTLLAAAKARAGRRATALRGH
jgi:acyl-coenzyme A synthetase/AMP-(fatty) acid ligase